MLEKDVSEISSIVSEVDAIIRKLETNFLRVLSLKAMCIELGENEDLHKVASNKNGTHGFNLVSSTVTESLIVCLIRIFDKKVNGRASINSLRNAFIQNPWLVRYYSEAAVSWPGNQGSYIEGKLNEGIERIESLLNDNEIIQKLEGVRDFRDYEIGHALLKQRTTEVKYIYLYDLVDVLHSVISDFYLCVTGISTNHKNYEEIYVQQARDLMVVFIKGFSESE